MSGMSEPKVVHQLQVRMARYVLQHQGETWLFNCEANLGTLYVYTDTDWAADELTRKSVSCTVERYGSHMLDCSVAKQSLVALSFEEAEFYGIVTGLGADRNERGGDNCLRQQCGERDVYENGIRKGTTPFNQKLWIPRHNV